MTILRSGSTQKYSDNFASAFGGKKTKAKKKKAKAKKVSATAKKKKAKKK